jgi:glycosyl transferase family 87
VQHLARNLFFAAFVVFVGAFFALFFEQLPIKVAAPALDWNGIWQSLSHNLEYKFEYGLYNPPWTALPLLPLGRLSMAASWGIVIYITLLALVASVPRTWNKKLYWLSVFLLIISYPTIRNIVDGNLEAESIIGVLLILYAYQQQRAELLALGILLATAKPQVVLLFMPGLGLYMLQTLPPRVWLKTGGLVLMVVLLSMLWRGQPWLDSLHYAYQSGTVIDASLMARLNDLGWFPPVVNQALWLAVIVLTLLVAWYSNRSLTREKAGMLIAASLLIAPYSSNVLTLVAIGTIPFFQKHPRIGAGIMAALIVQTFFNRPEFYDSLAYYTGAFLMVMWGALLWHVWQAEIRTPESVPYAKPAR